MNIIIIIIIITIIITINIIIIIHIILPNGAKMKSNLMALCGHFNLPARSVVARAGSVYRTW